MAIASAKASIEQWDEFSRKQGPRAAASPAQMLFPVHLKSPGAIMGKKVLDLGCGPYPEMLRRAGKYAGVDSTILYLEVAKKQIGGINSDFIRADVQNLPFRGESFDTVVAFRVVSIQGEGYRRMLSEMQRIAKETVIFTLYSVEHALSHGARNGRPIDFATLYEGKNMDRITMTSDQVRALLRAHSLRPRQMMFLHTGELYIEAEKAKPSL